MATDETRKITPPTTDEPEVAGHGFSGRGVKPEADQEPEVEGHGFSGMGKRQIDAAPSGDELEVEGHGVPPRRPISID